MTGLTSFLITMGVGVGILIAFFLIYYLGSIANTIYELKIEMRRELDGRMEDMWRHAEQEVSRRGDWMRSESEDAGNRLKEEIAAENFEYRKQVQHTLAEITKELRALRAQDALRGQGAPVKAKDATAPATVEAPKASAQAAAGAGPAARPGADEEPAGVADGEPLGALPAGKPA